MRVLFVTYEDPRAADAGDRLYTAGIIRGLISLGHEIEAVYYDKSASKIETVTQHPCLTATVVPFVRKNLIGIFFSLKPGMLANRYSKLYIDVVLRALSESHIDIVIVNHFKMTFVIEYINRRFPNTRTLFISHNAEQLLSYCVFRYQRNIVKWFAYYLDWMKTRAYEPRLLRMFSAVTAICSVDAQYYKHTYKLPRVETLPPAWSSRDTAEGTSDKWQFAVIVCGSFQWEPKKQNLLSLLGCREFKRFNENGIIVYVVGHADPQFVKSVNAEYVGVIMTGTVPDVRPYYDQCSVAIVPEQVGGGFKLKLLEAAANNCAIVAIRGAVTDNAFRAGVHYLESADFDEVVADSITLIKDCQLRVSLVSNASHLLKSRYSVESATGCLSNALQLAYSAASGLDK